MARAFGLPKARRLLTPAGYTRVFRHGCKRRDALFVVHAAPNALPHARLGLVVGRKAAARAVVRNHIRRQIRESFRHYHALVAGLDIVVLAQAGAASEPGSELRASLERHWQKIRERCKKS